MKGALISPLQCRSLSMLHWYGGKDGISATQLEKHVGTSRAVLYVLLGRLWLAGCVSRKRARVPGRNERQVLYAITPRGMKVRQQFARAIGFAGSVR